MKLIPLSQELSTKLDEARKRIFAGVDEIVAGCRIYVAVLDSNREAAMEYMIKKGIPIGSLDLIESVGRDKLDPRLIFMPGPGPARLQRAPLSVQDRLLNTGVEVARIVGGAVRVSIKPVAELTAAEAELALDAKGNVPVDTQKERLTKQILSNKFRIAAYALDEDALVVRANVTIPYDEFERLYLGAKTAHETKIKRLQAEIKQNQITRQRPRP